MSARLVKTVLERARMEGVSDDKIAVSVHAGQDIFRGLLIGLDAAGGFATLDRGGSDGVILLSVDKIIGITPRWSK